ncbi:energy transducer TonB [Pseudoalteromonas sp. GCY]|uniref:TonB family protein n=1 Tax=Pseudoalteromonas sp. GCY TaxID=2003316 RepID=UPI000BFF079A|nr:TonB family protein [Pseudoalteromonas sp. GCY]PHI35091.1 energy transducer TonB [Pseudoalteromonas sp. GCY]QQQ64532.1 TonB family protein [Pseudoalteromonas sp. GCY]
MRNNLISGLIFSFFLSISWLTKADLYDATLAYQNEEFTLAFSEFNRLAQLGNADAMYNLGVMYLYGQGTAQSAANAFAWFSLAKEFGIAEAFQTAQLVLQQSDDKSGLKDFVTLQKNRLADTYLLDSTLARLKQPNIVSTPSKTHDVLPDYPDEAVRQGIEGWVWLEFDIDQSGKATNIEVVDSYPKHIFTASLLNAVEKWRYSGPKQAHTLIYHFATYKGDQYRETLAIQKKAYEKQLRQNIDAAERGVAQVQYYIANWLSMKDYNAYQLLRYHWRSEEPVNELYLAAAKNGLDLAQYRLATQLINVGEHQLSVLWLEHAAKTMDIAKYRLARSLLTDGEQQNAPRALQVLTEASNNGHLRSTLLLANTYLSRLNDKTQAKTWLRHGLTIDPDHPELLLLSAKLTDNQSEAKKLASQALKSASQRNWSSKAIRLFQQKLAN